jgi:hypothetical protein
VQQRVQKSTPALLFVDEVCLQPVAQGLQFIVFGEDAALFGERWS